ncbi:hypothetical protein NEAUS03_0068 [Nematocida ausubeli]|nr:hypothetical protein NEAUS03_0068 [Nematocida ausubeli]
MARKSSKEKTPPSSEISQILLEGEGLLKNSSPLLSETPIQDFKGAPDSGLDGSFQIEDKSYQFPQDDTNNSFYGDIKKGPFHSTKPINKDLTDRILFKEIKFPAPARRGRRYRNDPNVPQLVDPDESLDIGTGSFQRKRPIINQDKNEDPQKIGALFNDDNMPTADTSFTKFVGFKTAEGAALHVSEECMHKARRSFDFMQSRSLTRAPPKPKIILPREREITEAHAIYKRVKQEIFPLTRSKEEEYSLFVLFQWAWISVLRQIENIRKRGGDSQAAEIERVVVEKAKAKWRANPRSVLRRITEQDEHASVYMKVLVVEGGTSTITITDGLNSIKAQLDYELQRIAKNIKEGMILQVACSIYLLNHPASIYEVNLNGAAVIELQYNGVKPCTSGPLGYQNTFGFIRSLSSINPQGGYINCLMLRVTKKIEVRYVIDLNGSKSNIEEDRLDSTLERIERSIDKICFSEEERNNALNSVKLRKYTRYEVVCDYSSNHTTAILSVWEAAYSDNPLKPDQRYLFFMLSPPRKTQTTDIILLTTTIISTFRKI